MLSGAANALHPGLLSEAHHLPSLPVDVLGWVASFFDEIDLYCFENAFPEEPTTLLAVSTRRWESLDEQDEQRQTQGCTNSRWRRSIPPAASGAKKDDALRRGRDYAEAAIFTRRIAAEACAVFGFDGLSHCVGCGNPTRPRLHRHCVAMPSISPCWTAGWQHPAPAVRGGDGHVFLNLSLRDGTDRSWEGYRRIKRVSATETLLSLDVAALVTEMGWRELQQYHDAFVRNGHEGALRDPNGSTLRLATLMRPVQITVTVDPEGATGISGEPLPVENGVRQPQRNAPGRRGLVLATGGFQSADTAFDGYLSSGAFQDRCFRSPLAVRINGDDDNSAGSGQKDGRYRTWMRISAHRIIFRLERPFLGT